jgi:CubicO group peptidase (beta-lactamase class C family)
MRAFLFVTAACGSAATVPASHHGTAFLGETAVTTPAGWSVDQAADRVTLRDPERDLHVFVLESPGDAEHAIAAAWQRVEPGFALVANPPDEQPDPEGWDAVTTITYTTPTAAHRTALATWHQLAHRGYVVLIDGDANAVERRDADLDVIDGTLHPPGFREPTLTKRQPIDTAALDAFIDHARARLEVPGAAVAVIVDGKVAYERTVGLRSNNERALVTADTRFLIASITKPMTTLMEGALVDAGVLRWDTPVTTLLPTFALGDAAMTRALRLWHMSCACTGMPRQDLEDIFEWEGITPEMRIATMRTMRPTTKLGETFQYSNLMVAAGGFAAAHAFAPQRTLAEAYAAAMQAKIFGPIGMTATTLDFATVEHGEHATPHARSIDGSTVAMPLAIERTVEPIAPAGGVWTTLHDMERYVETELADGVAPDGTRVVSVDAVRERRRVRVRSDEHTGYGLGIDVGTYAGLRELSHDGGAFGFGTTMFMLPEEHFAIIIFTNVRNGSAKQQLPFNAAVKRRILEARFADAKPLAERELAYYAKLRVVTPRVASPDHTWVAPLVGRYRDPALGTVEIRATATGAQLDAGEWQTAIDRESEPDGTVKLIILDPPFAGGSLIVGPGPTLLVPGQTSYTFVRDH